MQRHGILGGLNEKEMNGVLVKVLEDAPPWVIVEPDDPHVRFRRFKVAPKNVSFVRAGRAGRA